MDSLYQSLLGLLGGGLSGWIVTQHQRRLDKRDEEERRTRESELAAAREMQWQDMKQNVQSLKDKIDQHIKEDKSQALLTEMKHVNGNLEKLTMQVSRALETNAGQSKDIENNKQYISNVREDLQTHIRECSRRK